MERKNRRSQNCVGFTLIELLVVIAIIATIVAFAMPNFLGARQRAADIKKKAEVIQLKNALRIYYNDYNSYPAHYNGGSGKLNYIKGCGILGASECPTTPACSSSVDFTAGGSDGCAVIYMKKFPKDLGNNTMNYCQITGGDDFRLYVTLDNASDSDLVTSQSRCPASNCKASWASSDYVVCAD